MVRFVAVQTTVVPVAGMWPAPRGAVVTGASVRLRVPIFLAVIEEEVVHGRLSWPRTAMPPRTRQSAVRLRNSWLEAVAPPALLPHLLPRTLRSTTPGFRPLWGSP